MEAALACELGPDLENDITCDCLKVWTKDAGRPVLVLVFVFL